MVRLGLAQINTTVGDIRGNTALIRSCLSAARDLGAQVVAFPELAVTGYPPEDLLLKSNFVAANLRSVQEIAAATDDVIAIVGFVDQSGGALYNAAAICFGGELRSVFHKHLLPNYGVFDERRYFRPGRGHTLIETQHGVIGVCVCEDAWSERGPVTSQGDAGAQVIVNINGSPFHKGKLTERTAMLAERARRAKASIAYVNMVGGQDELVFDGGSMVLSAAGETVGRLGQFEEALAVVDVPLGEPATTRHPSIKRIRASLRGVPGGTIRPVIAPELERAEEVYRALTTGLGDYVRKNGFEKVVVGLSGGIDSSLTAAISVDALGGERVLGVAMPSEFSTSHSVDDAKALAHNLGIEMHQIAIGSIFHSYLKTLAQVFGPVEMGLAEENVQARIRGNMLMAISNRYGHLVIATGNKSEMACGYSTLYGDMAGGFALLKDVFKTEVYELARYRNSIVPVIPDNVMTKPPSAELRPGQKDADSLPPYEQLDPVLEAYIERDEGFATIIGAGHDPEIVEKVIQLVDGAEYKRRQAPPGPKVTIKAFGRDRRLPITNRWSDDQPTGTGGEERQK
jgi:NAD+ synthase (glutamine-hydrolysing)